jgi:hypothetical protein
VRARQLVRSLPAAVAALLLLSAALSVLGAILESHSGGSEIPTLSVSEPAGHSDTEGHAEGGAEEHATEPSTHLESTGETVLGIRIDSPGAVTAAAIVAVALASLVWRRPTRWVTAAVVLVAAGAAALDIAEISHQAREDRGGLAAQAAIIALTHLAVAIGAVILWRRAGSDQSQLGPATS